MQLVAPQASFKSLCDLMGVLCSTHAKDFSCPAGSPAFVDATLSSIPIRNTPTLASLTCFANSTCHHQNAQLETWWRCAQLWCRHHWRQNQFPWMDWWLLGGVVQSSCWLHTCLHHGAGKSAILSWRVPKARNQVGGFVMWLGGKSQRYEI